MKNKITCIITDDEPFARKGLEGYVAKTPFLNLIAICEDGLQLNEVLKTTKPDLLFLDIEMPHITGVEILRTLPDPPKVIFTTAYEQYALQGYELDVLDYLLKPISYQRFQKAAYKALDYFMSVDVTAEKPQFMFVKCEGKLEKIAFDELLYLEGMENYVAVYTTEKRMIIHSTIKSLLEKLPGDRFIQTHKSYVAAVDKIKTIDGNMIQIGKYQVPISRMLREEVMKKLVR